MYRTLKYFYYNLFSYYDTLVKEININYDDYWEGFKKQSLKGNSRDECWREFIRQYQNNEIDRSPRYRILSDKIEHGSSVLDLGMGFGLVLDYLTKEKGIKPYGIDISRVAVEQVSEYCKIPCQQQDITSPDFELSGEYDYILVLEVLEHIPNPAGLLRKLQGKFKKALIISFPNIGFFIHRLRLLFGKSPMDWVQNPDEHLHHWSLPDFKWWLGEVHASDLNYQIDKSYFPYGITFLKEIWPTMFSSNIMMFLSEKNNNKEIE